MIVERFEKESKKVLEHCWQLLFSKAKEYASDYDRLANFKQPCSMLGMNPAFVSLCYDMKHVGSMVNLAKDIDKGIVPTNEMLLEKVGDYINYGLLFYANMLEEMEKIQPLCVDLDAPNSLLDPLEPDL